MINHMLHQGIPGHCLLIFNPKDEIEKVSIIRLIEGFFKLSAANGIVCNGIQVDEMTLTKELIETINFMLSSASRNILGETIKI